MKLLLLPALLFATGAWAKEIPQELPKMIIAGLAEATTEFAELDKKYGLRNADPKLKSEAGKLVLKWKTPKGKQAIAQVEIVGDISTSRGAFAWTWANKSVPKAMSATSRKIRAHGKTHNIPTLTKGTTAANLQFAEKLVSVATLFEGVEGIYGLEAKGKGVVVFLALGPVRVQK